MALLKDTVVAGSLRATDTLYATTGLFKIIKVATSNSNAAYSAGTAGQFLHSGGTSSAAYWGSLASGDIPTISITDKTSGTLPVNRGGTGATSFSANSIIMSGNGTTAAFTTRGVTTSIENSSTSTSIPTAAAVAAFVEGKNYTTNSGVTSITLTLGAGITVSNSGTAITTTGSRTISISGMDTSNGSTTKWLNQKGGWSTPTKGDLGLGNVENTALSTWTGTNKITTVGTISTGTWQGTAIASSYVGNLPGSKITSGTVAAAYLGTMTGASSSAAGASGAVPQPAAGKQTAYLRGDGTWQPAPVLSVGGLTGTITLDLLGISGAMHYKGTVSAIPPTSGTYNSGDVVVLSNTVKEYVYDGTNWRELGAEGSFKNTQTAVSDPTAGSSGLINFINSISQNTQGVITVTKLPVRVASTSQTGVIQITKDNANSFLNSLDTGSSTPVDNDYYISLYVSGGTTTTTYHRRPVSALWSYIKGKGDAVYKPKQTAVSSATAETTTATTFVHSITLDANGVITVKTRPLPTYNNYSLPIAKYNTLGGIKPAYTSTDAVTLTTTAATNTDKPTIAAKSTITGRYYAVEADKNGVAYVNVPWTNVNSSYLTGVTTTVSGSGNGVTNVTASGNTITVTKGNFLTSHLTYTSFTGNPTGNQTPGFGSTFTIQQISLSTTGQISGTDRTVTIPNTIAKNDTVGLIKPWYNHTSASTGPTAGSNATAVAVNTITTTSGRYYAIEADSNGRLFVNVPWTNVNSSYLTGITSTSSGSGNAVTSVSASGGTITYTLGSVAPATGSTSITTLGTITTGTWNGTAISGSYLGPMGGATSSAAGTKGAVPAPAAGDLAAFLQGDATWYKLNVRNGTGTGSIVLGGVGEQGSNSLPTATADNAYALGVWTTASGKHSHAEGYGTTASGNASHSEGSSTIASGWTSHAQGSGTIANHAYLHVFGEYNIGDTSTAAATERGNFIEIVGNGTASNSRNNARTLDWDGNEILAGSVTATAFIGNGSQLTNVLSDHTYYVSGVAKARTLYNVTDESIDYVFL